MNPDGTAYWLRAGGQMRKRAPGGEWETLHDNVRKFEISSDGTLWTVHDDNFVRKNGGQRMEQQPGFRHCGGRHVLLAEHYRSNAAENVVRKLGRSRLRCVEVHRRSRRDSVDRARRQLCPQERIKCVGQQPGFRIASDGTFYWLSTYGLMQRKAPSGSWENLAYDVSKFRVSADGALWTQHDDNHVRQDGADVWSNTRDFDIAPTGTLYRLSVSGLMQQKTPSGDWEDLGNDVSKFRIAADGALWTVHEDNYVRKNGANRWSNSRDFDVTPTGTLYWLGIQGLMQRKTPSGGWEDLADDVSKFRLAANGTLWTLHGDNYVRQDGVNRWAGSRDFDISPAGTFYWLGTTGVMERKAPSRNWKKLAHDVTSFELAADGLQLNWGRGGRIP